MTTFLDDLMPRYDVMRAVLKTRPPQVLKRCAYDTNGCAYFKTTGAPTLKICMGDGHYHCKECVNLTCKREKDE